jgi:DNA (cytosine-5)-methyltransferase 1
MHDLPRTPPPLGEQLDPTDQGCRVTPMSFTSVEVCAGAGGQAFGLHQAGFEHLALVEVEAVACETLRLNGKRLGWKDSVHEADLNAWQPPANLGEVTLLAGGIPCPPFSIAGKQLGPDDERDLFPAILRLARQLEPRAIQIENVRGLLSSKFEAYRAEVEGELLDLGYLTQWMLLNACDFGVPQLRPRTILVAMQPSDMEQFSWPTPNPGAAPTVGQALRKSMAARGWEHAAAWAKNANQIAPTLVGGSKKHGGPDLGPTRARKAWAELGVNGISIGNDVPGPGFVGMPRLTARQAATLQGFPESWQFAGRKTAAYRQIGNAFPPPVARAVGESIASALSAAEVARDASAA